MIYYLIIDDEPIAHRIIENYCEQLKHLEKKGNCYNVFEAMQFLNANSVDLLFLDINLPKLSGFDFLKTLPHPPQIIVTTAYKEFALEGYELSVLDYLLKPFSFDRFIKAVNKVVDVTQTDKNTNKGVLVINETNTKSFFVNSNKKYYQIFFEEVLFIEAYGHYTKVYLKNELIVSHRKISDFEMLLPKSAFIRCHKSFIVAQNKIRQIEGNRLLIESYTIPIGQIYKGNITKLLG